MRVHATKTNLTGAPSPAAGRCAIDTTGAGNEQVVRFAVDRSSTCMHACSHLAVNSARRRRSGPAGGRADTDGPRATDAAASSTSTSRLLATPTTIGRARGQDRTAMHHACMAQWCSRLPVYHGNSDTMMAGRGYVRCLHTRTRGGRGAGSGRVIRATFPYAQRRQAGQRRQGAQAAPAGDLIDVIRSAPPPPGLAPDRRCTLAAERSMSAVNAAAYGRRQSPGRRPGPVTSRSLSLW